MKRAALLLLLLAGSANGGTDHTVIQQDEVVGRMVIEGGVRHGVVTCIARNDGRGDAGFRRA